MENHAVLEPIDKHILLLEYSSPSHTVGILMSFLDHKLRHFRISVHIWNNIKQKLQGNKPVTWKSELFVLIEDNMACFNKNKRE